MRYFASASLLALAAPALAAPFRRAAAANDLLVLKFADALEQLETQFYAQALSQFQESDFTAAGFADPQVPIQQFMSIQSDEATHAAVLEQTIMDQGDMPITDCKFDFSSALTDVATMAATARVVENLGVAAYLGAASLITDPVILTAAGSILTVEARHQTILNLLSGSATAIPQAFDIALTPSEVLAVASPFITSGCALGVPANPHLNVVNTDPVAVGTTLQFQSSALNGSTDGLFCQMLVGGAPFSIALPFSQCTVPAGINGPVAIFITSDNQTLANNVRDRATTQLVAGPTMAFIDSTSQKLAELTRTISGSSASSGSSSSNSSSGSSDSGSSTSTETSTISGDQATSIISSASATGSASASATGSAAAAATASMVAADPSQVTNDEAKGVDISLANMFTGPSPDGHTTVVGWSNV